MLRQKIAFHLLNALADDERLQVTNGSDAKRIFISTVCEMLMVCIFVFCDFIEEFMVLFGSEWSNG